MVQWLEQRDLSINPAQLVSDSNSEFNSSILKAIKARIRFHKVDVAALRLYRCRMEKQLFMVTVGNKVDTELSAVSRVKTTNFNLPHLT